MPKTPRYLVPKGTMTKEEIEDMQIENDCIIVEVDDDKFRKRAAEIGLPLSPKDLN